MCVHTEKVKECSTGFKLTGGLIQRCLVILLSILTKMFIIVYKQSNR